LKKSSFLFFVAVVSLVAFLAKVPEGTPVIVFFDEMDSLFRTRGTGVSSDVENTIVPQLLSEIDGVESLENVIVIGASNREDMIDPAILRPGRLELHVEIGLPNEFGRLQQLQIHTKAMRANTSCAVRSHICHKPSCASKSP
jgi:SpoVK/Ycf46/Vps4 family AAA+-type ATPase